MKAEFPVVVAGKCIKVTTDVENTAELVEFIADMQELFDNTTCTRNGKSSDNVQFRVRNVDDNKFYELVCLDNDSDLRYAKKRFGVHKKGGNLFPHSKDSEGKWLPNNGWVIYNKESGKEE